MRDDGRGGGGEMEKVTGIDRRKRREEKRNKKKRRKMCREVDDNEA